MSHSYCSVCTRFHQEKRPPEQSYLDAMFTYVPRVYVIPERWECKFCHRSITEHHLNEWKAK